MKHLFLLFAILGYLSMSSHITEAMPSGNIQVSAIGMTRKNPGNNEVNKVPDLSGKKVGAPDQNKSKKNEKTTTTKRPSTRRIPSTPFFMRSCEYCCGYAFFRHLGFTHSQSCIFSCCPSLCSTC
ncbi:uncharacterized protein LOC130623373 [Hydractinia symbiolongicarpus]|uniref:uncharacterized protein LOC130623373 n=1 Tax=Hydractinia symbiolongicarpus TaxID=13093 RepID=UPI00254A2D87|nr:uncharacterized protein LOC130623373 [Hydractinia symbiolongicarpus]